MATYRIEAEPRYELHGDDGPLPGHYEAELSTDGGERMVRYLTDKGRASVLAILDEGRRELSRQEFEEHTVEPMLDALVARMEREAGEGA